METQAGGWLLPKVREMGAVYIKCKLDFLKRLFSRYLEVNGLWRVQERVVGEMFLGNCTCLYAGNNVMSWFKSTIVLRYFDFSEMSQ